MRSITCCFFLLTALLLGGCQTTHQFANPDASWKQSVGQLRYARGERVLVGDVVVRTRGAEDFQLEFQKSEGFPLISVRQEGGTTRMEGLLARGKWQGRAAAAPRPLRSWAHLREALSLQHGAGVLWEYRQVQQAGGQLNALSLRYPPSGESFDFHFSF